MCTLDREIMKKANDKALHDMRLEDIVELLDGATIDKDASALLFAEFQSAITCRLFVKHALQHAKECGRKHIIKEDIRLAIG